MKIKVLASGSKGNSTLIICNDTKILIDAGIPATSIKNILNNDNIDINQIDGILISHIHSDHIKGLPILVKKYNLKVYISPRLLPDLINIIPMDNINLVDDEFNINDVQISLLATSHDVVSYGFIINHNQSSLVYITDTGYINKKYYSQTENKTIYIVEANHDEQMLLNGPYPFVLKQRVISDKGHLSNHYTGMYLNKVIGNNTKRILLAHVSENNNTYDLALSQVKEALVDYSGEYDISVLHQDTEYEIIEV